MSYDTRRTLHGRPNGGKAPQMSGNTAQLAASLINSSDHRRGRSRRFSLTLKRRAVGLIIRRRQQRHLPPPGGHPVNCVGHQPNGRSTPSMGCQSGFRREKKRPQMDGVFDAGGCYAPIASMAQLHFEATRWHSRRLISIRHPLSVATGVASTDPSPSLLPSSTFSR